MRLGFIAVAALAVCAVALLAMPREGGAVELLKGDAESVANKVLKAQKFHKADTEEQEVAVKSALSAKGKGSKHLVNEIASVVADKSKSYRDRMLAMRQLLDHQTDKLKSKPLTSLKTTSDDKKAAPKHAEGKKGAARGRDGDAKAAAHATKAEEAKAKKAKEEKDNAKAIKEGEKLIHEKQKVSAKGTHKLHLSKKDKAIKEASEKKDADPKTMDLWMKKQAEGRAHAKHAAKRSAESRIAHNKQVASSDDPPAPGTSYAKLLAWAEAHGLPAKLANNPAKKAKVHDIIARMKADAEVAKIKAQFKQDDSLVNGVVHGADPGAAGVI